MTGAGASGRCGEAVLGVWGLESPAGSSMKGWPQAVLVGAGGREEGAGTGTSSPCGVLMREPVTDSGLSTRGLGEQTVCDARCRPLFSVSTSCFFRQPTLNRYFLEREP